MLDSCAECNGSFDYDQCWEPKCNKFLHPECCYNCDTDNCEGQFCSVHYSLHNCEEIKDLENEGFPKYNSLES